MSKTLGTYTAILTDQSIAADSAWTQSSSYVDISSVVGYIGLELKVKGSSSTLTDDVTLKVRPSLNGTTFCDADEGIPLAVINSAGTSYEVEVLAFDATPYDELAFYISNADDTNAATVSLSYRTSSV